MKIRNLPKPFTEKEWEILAGLYGAQFCTDYKQFRKKVYTFSFYDKAVPVGAPNYDELLREVWETHLLMKKDLEAIKSGEIISLGEALDSE